MPALISMAKPSQALFWTAPAADDSEFASEDPIALDYVGQQIGLLLLPALTTRSTRAQAFAMVLYGLWLVEDEPTDEIRRIKFERWERFWALATLEYRKGHLSRGDRDTMRGVRGAKAAYRLGDGDLPLDFQLISRQQELGNLGAYLVPLRRSELVVNGTLRPAPSAREIVDAFWDEPGENIFGHRYGNYARTALDLREKKLKREYSHLSLAKVGEKSRLSSLTERGRTVQQRRLYEALFVNARDPHTFSVCNIVESAAKAGVYAPRDILKGAMAGQFGAIDEKLRDLLSTALCFGDVAAVLLDAFDRIYQKLYDAGWVAPKAEIARLAFEAKELARLQNRCSRLLKAPCVDEIRRLPAHGAALLRLVDALTTANALTATEQILAYHSLVQRDRIRGEGWIRDEAGKLVLAVTSYSAYPGSKRFHSFKLDVVRSLLVDVGRISALSAGESQEGEA